MTILLNSAMTWGDTNNSQMAWESDKTVGKWHVTEMRNNSRVAQDSLKIQQTLHIAHYFLIFPASSIYTTFRKFSYLG